ncbi:MAG: DNA ligase D [Chitinophagaceae bacterium]|nr:DNA ligase D [Chitinophagaceae bacterium]
MSLATYKKKRSFEKTPEPSAVKKTSSSEGLRFVVQKHDASRLHYDFRLEMEGVLKSWAVPKGPSLNPDDKRLAMMVEDHPYDYRSFEGIIPEGNYGAGTVIVWDEGTYEPLESVDGGVKQQEKALLQQLREGNLKFRLSGKKLKGDYALVHIKGREENTWLLIKKKDKYASATDITKKAGSVQTGKTIEQVAGNKNSKQWGSKKASGIKKQTTLSKGTPTSTKPTSQAGKKKRRSGPAEKKVKEILKKAKTAPYNTAVKPMLASLTEKSFDDEDWIFEIKWDGYRAVAGIRNGKVELQSRNNLSFNKKFYPITQALEGWNVNAIVDGEIIAITDNGITDFQHLQAWQKTGKGQLIYYVFDLLWIEGVSVMQLPLIERKEILKSIVPAGELIRYSDHIYNTGNDFFELAIQEGLEGIMAKKADSLYYPGLRTQQWLKIKTHRRQEVVIGGFTKGRNNRQYFGALILGVYENNELVYIGHTGSGFNQKALTGMYKKLQPLITDECPFRKKPKTNMPAVWVKPKLVAEVKFQEWTNENILRIPIFLGLREDKNAIDVKKEQSNAMTTSITKTKKSAASKKSAKKTAAKKTAPVIRENEIDKAAKKIFFSEDLLTEPLKEQLVVVDHQELRFTNLGKYYWKKEKITKRDVLNYYHRIAPHILPYMNNRPQSLNRHPDGVGGMSFYQKDVTGKVPGWVETYDYISESDGEKKEFFVCTNEAGLLYMANWGCIEMNPWHSRITSPDKPDYCVIDLDPEKISFDKVIETANMVKKVLDELGINSYCKTSGSTGLHIYIPLAAKYTYEQSRQLAELVVQFVHDEIPSFTSLERSPGKRQKKVYLDYLQNRTIQTLAAPYSLRPKDGATVSAPLHWEEVKKGILPADFTMNNIVDRIKDEGDLFKPVLQKGIDLYKALIKINELLEKKS